MQIYDYVFTRLNSRGAIFCTMSFAFFFAFMAYSNILIEYSISPSQEPSTKHSGESYRRSSRDRKVAVCIVGLWRDHFEKVFPVLKNTILSDDFAWDADIFVETWKYRGVSRKQRLAGHHSLDTVDEEMVKKYPKMVYYSIETSPKGISHGIKGVHIPQFFINEAPKDWTGTIPSFYKRYKCHLARLKHEKTHNFTYAAVLVMRPDSKFFQRTNWDCQTKLINNIMNMKNISEVYSSKNNINPRTQFSDKYFMGSSYGMGILMNGFKELNTLFTNKLKELNHTHPPYHAKDIIVGERLMKYFVDHTKLKYNYAC